MKKTIFALAACLIIAMAAFAQKQSKPWKEWNRKEAEKMLTDSPWSRSQTESASNQSEDISTSFGNTRGREDAVRGVPTNSSVTLHVRFFTARPVRQAYVRMLELADPPPEAARAEQMTAWANLAADDRIIVALGYSGDQRLSSRVANLLRTATTSDMKTSAFLERNDGKRVALAEYVPPGKDIFGARLIFPRTLDGQPFVIPEAATIRFHVEYASKIPDAAAPQSNSRGGGASRPDPYRLRLDMKFKVSDMMYGGVLEY